MKPRQWMQVAAIASALGLTGTAVANDMDRTPGASSGTSAATLDDNASAQINGSSDNASSVPYDNDATNDDGAAMNDNATTNDNDATTTNDNDASSDLNATPAAPLNHGGDLNNSADLSGNASSSTSSDLNATPAAPLNHGGDLNNSADVNGSPSLSNGGSSEDLNGQVDRGATQGSTMASPRSNASSDANAASARLGSGSNATTIGGQDRLGNTNSDRFDTSTSDYTTQHDNMGPSNP